MNEDIEHYLWDNELLAKDNEEYFLLDDLGSPLRQLTSTGQTVGEYGYDEFGQSLFNVPIQQPFGFTGYQYDDVSGLNYAQARYYDHNQGRFVSEDNIKGSTYLPKSLNPYSYVWNTPLTLIDLDGNRPEGIDSSHLENDWAGRDILWHYLYGDGKDLNLEDSAKWSTYMKNNKNLSTQVSDKIKELSNPIPNNSSIKVDEQFPMEIENGESIVGYQYLHGTNADAGGFTIEGTISKDSNGNVKTDLRYTWNDIIDPNFIYETDSWKANFAKSIPFANPKDYRIKISWKDDSTINANGEFTSGWLRTKYNWWEKLLNSFVIVGPTPCGLT